jgi:polyisoprenoid-binding protein YceI
MKKAMMVAIATAIIATGVIAQTTWKLDNAHSNVKFSVTHLIISEVEGGFKAFSGKLESSKPDFTDASINFSVDVNSINTENEMRDKHLKSDDFFNAEKFPAMTFKGISWKKVDEKNYKLEGDLTIRDVTKRIVFNVVYGGIANDPWGNTKAGFKATAVINRLEYGLKWNTMTEAGGAVVGKDVTIVLNLEFAKEKTS